MGNEVVEFGEVVGLDDAGVGAELVGFVEMSRVLGAAEDDEGKIGELMATAEPGEDIEAGHLGEVQIQQSKTGQGKLLAISKLPVAGKIINGVFAIGDDQNAVGDA